LLGGADVFDSVVDEKSFAGADAELVAGEVVDGGVRLGDAEFAGPGELVEAGEPREFLAHGAEDFGPHVGEDSGEDAVVLQGGGPGKHGLVEIASPHEDVVFDECVDFAGGEREAGVAAEFGPVTAAVEEAEIVVVAVTPVEALEGVAIEAGAGEEAAVGGGIGGAQDLAVVEDDSLHKNRVQGHREPGTGNREPGTGNREPGTGNREPGTGNREPGRGMRGWCFGCLWWLGTRCSDPRSVNRVVKGY